MENINKQEIHNIFQQIKHGKKEAIEELFKKYKKLIERISFTIVKSMDITEEISQMVFVKIIQIDINKLPENNELSWLYTVTKNQTIDYLRKEHNNVNIDDIYEISEETRIDEIIDMDTYNNMIECLSEQEKEIVSLKVLGDLKFREIGLILNMPTATVQWRYYKALHSLRLFLANAAMFIITFMLYIKNKSVFENSLNSISKSNDKNEKDSIDESKSEKKSHDNTQILEPTDIINNEKEDIESYTQTGTVDEIKEISINKVQVGLFSLSVIFLILSIVFGIVVVKHRRKK